MYEKISATSAINDIADEVEDLLSVIIKDDKLYLKLLNQLSTALVNSYDKKRVTAITEAIEYLVSLDKKKFTKKHIKEIDSILKKHLSTDLASIVESSVKKLNERIFKSGLTAVSEAVSIKLSFDVADKYAAEVLGNHNLFWIESYYSKHLQEKINESLEDYFLSNKTIQEVAKDFEKEFNDKTEKGIEYFDQLALHTTQRVRELGKITGYEKAGLKYYQIKAQLDERTTEICDNMHNRIFPVEAAVKFKEGIIALEKEEDIIKFAPWRKLDEIENVATEDLPPGMELPPYHWGCRTITVAYFE